MQPVWQLLAKAGYLDEIPICVAYRIGGRETEDFQTALKLARAEPVFRNLPGWKEDISGVTPFQHLPDNARRYVRYIEKATGFPVGWISVGPHRDALFR